MTMQYGQALTQETLHQCQKINIFGRPFLADLYNIYSLLYFQKYNVIHVLHFAPM